MREIALFDLIALYLRNGGDVPTLRIVVAPDAAVPSVRIEPRGASGRSFTIRLGHERTACEMLVLKLIQSFGPDAGLVRDESDFCARFFERFGRAVGRGVRNS